MNSGDDLHMTPVQKKLKFIPKIKMSFSSRKIKFMYTVQKKKRIVYRLKIILMFQKYTENALIIISS